MLFWWIYFVLISSISFSIPILVNVKESLQGDFPYFNYSIKGNIVYIKGVWENVGSVTCDTYLRLKIETNTKTYNFWSKKVNVPPGGSGTLEVFAYLPNESKTKNITITPYFYYCNEIKRLRNISLLNYNTTFSEINENTSLGVNFKTNTYNNGEFLLTINKTQNISKIYIIPISPEGWILPSLSIKVHNESILHVPYEFYKPEHTKCCSNVIILSEFSDGEYTVYKKTINFSYYHPQESNKRINGTTILLILSVLLNIALILLLLRRHK